MRRISLVTKLFFTLSILTLLPFLFIATLSDSALLSTFEEDASRIGLGRLEGIQALGSTLSESIRFVCLGVAVDSRVNRFERWPVLDSLKKDPESIYFLWSFQNDLADRVRTNELLSSLIFRPRDADYVIDSGRGTIKETEAPPPTLPDDTMVAGWTAEGPLVYVFPLSLFVTKTRGTIEVQVDAQKLGRWINPSQGEDRISLLDLEGRVFASGRSSDIGKHHTIPPQGKDRSHGARLVDGPEGKTLEAWLCPEGSPWIYFGEFSFKALDRGLNERRAWILGVCLLLIVATLGLSYLVSRGFFGPIADLVTRVRGLGSKTGSGSGNEVRFLSETFLRLEGTRRREVEAWILTNLEGNPSLSVPEEFPGPRFRCAAVQIDNYQEFRVRHTPDEQSAWARTWLEEICLAFSGPNGRCRGVCLAEGRMAVVLNGEGPSDHFLTATAGELSQRAKKVNEFSLSFCWGDPHRGPPGLLESWKEAETLQEVRFLRGPGIYYVADLYPKPDNHPLTSESVNRLLISLESGRVSALEEALHRITVQVREHAQAGQGQARLSLYQIASAVLSWMSENALDPAEVFGPDFHLYRDLASQETLASAEEWLLLVCTRLVESLAQQEKTKLDPAVRILTYLRDHYQEDCDVAKVSREVGLSYSHVRRVFSQKIGEPISIYLNRLRIEDVKHLLRNTDLSLEEIAVRVGYHNTQSLQRFFRRLAGTTPGAYRNRLAEHSNGNG